MPPSYVEEVGNAADQGGGGVDSTARRFWVPGAEKKGSSGQTVIGEKNKKEPKS